MILFLASPLSAQYSWRFSPSYTFDAPALSKKDLADRAVTYQVTAELEQNAPIIYQYDTKHQTSWFLFTDHKFMVGNKEFYSIIEMFVAIIPENGKYRVLVEKADVFVRSGMKVLIDNDILRADDSAYSDKLTKSAVTHIKGFIQEQFDALIPQIRAIMENTVDGVWLKEEAE